MDAELKAKWVKALRSGEYKQARGFLKQGNSFCCIGVGYICKTGKMPENTVITSPAAEALGLNDDQSDLLIEMNDGKRMTFPQIADWIEANL